MKKALDIALLLALAAPAGALAQGKGVSDGVVKLGVLTDMTGYYSDLSGPGSVLAARMAAQDFGGKVLGKPIDVISADHQLKADVASNTARKWFDEQQVDAVVALVSAPGTTAITGDKCNAYTVHYTYDNWAMANGTGREVVEQGGKTWFFITAD